MRSTGKAGATARERPVHGAGVPGGVSRSRSLLDREILAHAIPVGTEPVGVAVALVADTVFVTNVIGETVWVINGQTNTVTVNISPPAGNSPARVAFSPLTGTVYVAGNGNVSAIPFTTCTITITGTHLGPLTIGPGTTCVEPGAVITGR